MTRDKKEFIEAILLWFNTPKVGNDEVLDRQFLADAYDNITQPHWISVEEELPKEHEWILGFSLKREYIDVYNFDSNGLIEAHDITHWMHLSPPPVLSNSEKTGKDLKGGEK